MGEDVVKTGGCYDMEFVADKVSAVASKITDSDRSPVTGYKCPDNVVYGGAECPVAVVIGKKIDFEYDELPWVSHNTCTSPFLYTADMGAKCASLSAQKRK